MISCKLIEYGACEHRKQPVARVLANEYVNVCFEFASARYVKLVGTIYALGSTVCNDMVPENLRSIFLKLVP